MQEKYFSFIIFAYSIFSYLIHFSTQSLKNIYIFFIWPLVIVRQYWSNIKYVCRFLSRCLRWSRQCTQCSESYLDGIHNLSHIEFVFGKLPSLKNSFSAGADGIPAYFLKLCGPSLSLLYHLFQQSLIVRLVQKNGSAHIISCIYIKLGQKRHNKVSLCMLYFFLHTDQLLQTYGTRISQYQHSFCRKEIQYLTYIFTAIIL